MMRDKFFAFPFYAYCILFIFLTLGNLVVAQEGGLSFRSYDKVQNERTSLLFSPAFNLDQNSDLELKFHLKFKSNQVSYYGYVFRIILDHQFNIDLISEDFGKENKAFSIVVGDQHHVLKLSNDAPGLYGWLPVSVRISKSQGTVEVSVNGLSQSSPFPYKGKGNATLCFGANNISGFSTTDVPPIAVRDIQLLNKEKVLGRWLLEENEGNEVSDSTGRRNGLVDNPNWIKALHTHWQPIADLKLSPATSVAFDKIKERIIFVGDTALQVFELSTGTLQNIVYRSGPLGLQRGNQSIYLSETNTLYNIFPDEPILNVFDFETQKWTNTYKKIENTAFWHANKFFSPLDSAMYLLGGYGYYTYKGGLTTASLQARKFDTVFTADRSYAPRYLSAVGKTRDGAYIFGGFGSKSGKQGLNPHHFYDMLYFDFETKRIRKLWEIPRSDSEFVLANSMWIDTVQQQFYALTYPKNVFDSAIKLMRGSLSGGSLSPLADSIPFRFQDINSFADLYFAESNEQLIAVTLYDDGIETSAQLYSLNFPPTTWTATGPAYLSSLTWGLTALALVGVVLVALWLVKRKADSPLKSTGNQDRTVEPYHAAPLATPKFRNKISLFGNFEVLDRNGVDITKEFTPVLKQLFLVIVLQSVLSKTGVSSERLYELLWSDKSIKSARNNLLVNIGKLKAVLCGIDGILLSKDTGYWRFQFSQGLQLDLLDFWQIRCAQEDCVEQMLALSSFLEQGTLLMDLDFEWMDEAKGLVASKVADSYTLFLKNYPVRENAEVHLLIAKRIGHYDLINEDAMSIRCLLLAQMGLHQEAKQAYDSFAAEYQKLYGEEYAVPFKEIIKL